MTMTTVEELAAPAWRSGSAIVLARASARWRSWGPMMLIAPFVALILASYAVPLWYQLHGNRLLVVTSGSMAPEIAAGDAVVIQQVTDASQLRVGQIITFYPTGSATLVTHRIVGMTRVERVDPQGNGVLGADGQPIKDPYVKTKGDANRVDDPNLTPATSVRGIVREVHPGWGVPLAWAHSPMGRLLLFVPPLLILALLELRSRSLVDLAPLADGARRLLRRPRRDDEPTGDADASSAS
jgi:signal peptidase I